MAADILQKRHNYVNRVVDEINVLLDCHDRLLSLIAEYQQLDYGSETTGINDELLADSNNKHLDRAFFLGGMTSIGALDALFLAGHGTNLQRFRR